MAKSRPSVLSAFKVAVSASLPPQAVTATSDSVASNIVGRNERIDSRMQKLLRLRRETGPAYLRT